MFFAKENRLWMQISAPEIEKTGKSCYTGK
jgi:hypothetical protein